jgi:hypothetical protein
MKASMLPAIALTWVLAALPAHSATTQLLSLGLLPIKAGQYVSDFVIDTQGVDILAVCHVPFGWKITAGIDDAVTGSLQGHAGLGVSFIHDSNRAELDGLFLVRVYKFTTRWDGSMPPTFLGRFNVGRYGDDGASRRVKMTPANIKLAGADRCPPPRD